MGSTATILHADLDAFYASVEQLLTLPARRADCGRRRRRARGILRARAFGVQSGMPARGARTLSPPRLHRRTFQRIPAARRRRRRSPERLIALRQAHLHRRGLRRRGRMHASQLRQQRSQERSGPACAQSLACRYQSVSRVPSSSRRSSEAAKPDGLVIVDPKTELDFLHSLPVELMWASGPAPEARLARTASRRSVTWRSALLNPWSDCSGTRRETVTALA